MKASEIKEILQLSIREPKEMPPIFLWGGPGIGKSSLIKQAAEEEGVNCIDIRLVLLDPTDLRGIPVPEEGKAKWLPPSFLPRDGRGVVFLDELNCQIAGEPILYVRPKSGQLAVKTIEKVKIGDTLLSYNLTLNSVSTNIVTRTFNRLASGYYCIEFENGEQIKLTSEHPVLTERGWLEAKELKPGDRAYCLSALWQKTQAVDRNTPKKVPQLTRQRIQEALSRSSINYTSSPSDKTRQLEKDLGTISKNDREGSSQGYRLVEITRGARICQTKIFEELGKSRASAEDINRVKTSEAENNACRFGVQAKHRPNEIGAEVARFLSEAQSGNRVRWRRKAMGSRPLEMEKPRFPCLGTETEGYPIGSILLEEPRIGNGGLQESGLQSPKDFLARTDRRGLATKKDYDFLEPVEIVSVKYIEGDVRVYNLQCEPDHIYYSHKVVLHNCAAPLVQNSGLQLVLDRRIGEYVLPDGYCIIAAGNREMEAFVHRMSPPLLNRFLHLDFDVDNDEWAKWAVRNNVAPQIIGLLTKFRPELLYKFEPQKKAYPTPRSWEFTSKILQNKVPEVLRFELVKGCIGEGAAIELNTYMEIWSQLPDLDEILSGKDFVPKSIDLMYACCIGLVSKAKKPAHYDRLIQYALKLEREFSVFIVKMLWQKSKELVVKAPSWSEFAKTLVVDDKILS